MSGADWGSVRLDSEHVSEDSRGSPRRPSFPGIPSSGHKSARRTDSPASVQGRKVLFSYSRLPRIRRLPPVVSRSRSAPRRFSGARVIRRGSAVVPVRVPPFSSGRVRGRLVASVAMMMTDFFWFLGPHAQDNDLRVWMVREEAHPLFRKGASLVTLLLDHRGPPQYFHMQSLALAVARPSGAPSYRRWLTCDEGSEAIERVAEEINPPRSQCSEEGECEADRLPAVINLMREGPCMGVWLHPDLFAPFVTWLRAEPPSAPLERRPALPAARVVDGRARAAESGEVRRFVAAVLGDEADGEWCKERARMHDPHALPGGQLFEEAADALSALLRAAGKGCNGALVACGKCARATDMLLDPAGHEHEHGVCVDCAVAAVEEARRVGIEGGVKCPLCRLAMAGAEAPPFFVYSPRKSVTAAASMAL
eukprot:jgi/Mesvir1/26374/Mv23104-RA.1